MQQNAWLPETLLKVSSPHSPAFLVLWLLPTTILSSIHIYKSYYIESKHELSFWDWVASLNVVLCIFIHFLLCFITLVILYIWFKLHCTNGHTFSLHIHLLMDIYTCTGKIYNQWKTLTLLHAISESIGFAKVCIM